MGVLPEFALRGLVHASAAQSSVWCFASLAPALRIRVTRVHQPSHGKSVERALAGPVASRWFIGREDMVEDESGTPASSSTLPDNYPGSWCLAGAGVRVPGLLICREWGHCP